ncbi:MAG: hypothetical protein HY862_06595 [Chloroflexi bacterium]|nr:hypothetical protein [Chloroflexota bacterium]
MVKLHSWIRIFVIIMVIVANLIVGIESAAGQGQTFSGSLSSGPGAGGPSQATYVISATAGDTLNFAVDYSGSNSCLDGWLLLSVNDQLLSPWLAGLYSDFSGTVNYAYVMPATMDITVKIEIACRHATSIMQVMYLAYTMNISVGDASTVDPITTEITAGIQRVTVDNSLPVTIYVPTLEAQGELFIHIWQRAENGFSYPRLTISADDLLALPDFPTENLLIASTADEFIRVYKLTTGEFQVNVGPLDDGKIHVLIFDGIPFTRVYGYTFSVEP